MHLQQAPTLLTALMPARAKSLKGPLLTDLPDVPDALVNALALL